MPFAFSASLSLPRRETAPGELAESLIIYTNTLSMQAGNGILGLISSKRILRFKQTYELNE